MQRFLFFFNPLYVSHVIGDLGVNFKPIWFFVNGTYPPTVEAAEEVDLIMVQVLVRCVCSDGIGMRLFANNSVVTWVLVCT